ncbi:MAG: prepilin peptidase [Planctomycetes bacterium]|nr:prepilin peptidase [Planctomycetota bacterium]
MDLLRIGLLAVALLIALYTDLAYRKIYNWLTYPLMGLGLGLAGGEVIFSDDWMYLYPAMLGLGLSLFIFLVPCLLGWLGGGDLKLFMGIGCLQGAPFDHMFMFSSIYYVSLVGAIMAMLVLIWRGRLLNGLLGSFKLLVKPKQKNADDEVQRIPYGVAISLGTFWTMFVNLS